jgi:mandelate racemase
MNTQPGSTPKLTFESVQVRAVSVPFRMPIASKVGEYTQWPVILIDVKTKEGVVGRSYLEPYVRNSVKNIGQAIQDLGELFKGKPLAPIDIYRDGLQSLHLNGREGMSLIAIPGLDMAVWDALAKAANLPLAVLLGGTTGKVRAYNTNGLWLIPLDRVAREAEELVADGGGSRPSSCVSAGTR